MEESLIQQQLQKELKVFEKEKRKRGKREAHYIYLSATDRSLRNLVRELQRNGIALKTENIFAT